jgi:cytoskeletal protein CcmA (bactofilin family)
MPIWKDNTATRLNPTPAPEEPTRYEPPPRPEPAANPTPTPPVAPMARVETPSQRKESVIASDITIEGKIEGGGSVRIAGKFKGDVNVQGDLTVDAGAKLTGSVRADRVTISGELEGNVEQASLVDLQRSGVIVGDVKAGSLAVAAGARLRGQAEFGWDDGKGAKGGKHG